MSIYGVPESQVMKTAESRGDGRTWRYRLEREWTGMVEDTDEPYPHPPTMTFVMLNPSTADDVRDDPTIRRCVGIARREGCTALVVVNLYNLRATKPMHLWEAPDPVGRDHPYKVDPIERALTEAAEHGEVVVAAWGTNARQDRVREVLGFAHADRFVCLGVTADGSPRHPLYVKGDTRLVPWPVS